MWTTVYYSKIQLIRVFILTLSYCMHVLHVTVNWSNFSNSVAGRNFMTKFHTITLRHLSTSGSNK